MAENLYNKVKSSYNKIETHCLSLLQKLKALETDIEAIHFCFLPDTEANFYLTLNKEEKSDEYIKMIDRYARYAIGLSSPHFQTV